MKKLLLSILVLLLLAGAGVGAFLYSQAQRLARFLDAPFGAGEAIVLEIPPGTGPKGVAALLANAGVVSDSELLYGYLRKEKLGPKLKAGEYEFAVPLTPPQVVAKLIAGQVRVYRFTVPEGLRVDETLPILAASALSLKLARLNELASDKSFVRGLGIPADSLEGFLFPDTYTFTRGATEEAVLTKMVSRALEEHKKATQLQGPGIALGLLEAMTLASIIEKETGAPSERPRIGCVFHNRLRLKMKLQTDPTVIFAMMALRGTYSKNITRKDLETDHPYNTYTRPGLPPGPIASPGAAAIQAALAPIECKDLFFVSRNDGSHIFCPDLRCHEDAVKKWQVEFFRKKRGAN